MWCNGPFVHPDIWMIGNSHDKHSKSELALPAHRLFTEIQQVILLYRLVWCVRCPDKSGIWWCLCTVILFRQCLVEERNSVFDNCKFKIWCYCLSFWILCGILFFCVHIAWLTVWRVALCFTVTACRGTFVVYETVSNSSQMCIIREASVVVTGWSTAMFFTLTTNLALIWSAGVLPSDCVALCVQELSKLSLGFTYCSYHTNNIHNYVLGAELLLLPHQLP